MFSNKKQILLTVLSLVVTVVVAQERDQDTIKTDVINVVKPYTPTISDAFKVKEIPSLNDQQTATKKEIKYNIFSFPVASTFTPAKGKAAVVDKVKKAKLFDNYATLGVGTYTTVLGEVYLNHELGRGESVSAYAGHHSSQGGIDGVLVDDDFSDSKINLSYSKRNRDLSWTVEGGFQLQSYNWYGLPLSQTQGTAPLIDQTTIDGLDVGHSFTNGHISGDITFEDSYIKSGSILFRRFGDNQGSGENRFTAKAIVDVPVSGQKVSTGITFDYLGGSFDSGYDAPNTELNYGNFQVGIAPKYQLNQDDLSVEVGFTAAYLNDTEAGKNKFFIYPNINASYRLVEEVLIAFGGVKGDLIQNSYYDFAKDNPFVSPTLFVTPTDQQYNAFLGLKGKLSNTMSYNVNGHYLAEKSKALFINNDVTTSSEAYTFGNSFGVVYDDVSTFSIGGELNVDMNRNFTLGLKGEYFIYDVKNETEAWNLPDFKASMFLDYQISEQWFAGANLFFVGERKDLFNVPSLVTPQTSIITLDGYFDANVHIGYHINDRFSVYVKGNNLAGEEYTKWQNTAVQGIQFLAGATYKFDF